MNIIRQGRGELFTDPAPDHAREFFHPHEKEICGERCHQSINELSDFIDRILIILPPTLTERIVMELNPAFISYVWMQNGAESPEAIRICREKGLQMIYVQCILMHAEPVRSYHLLHRWWEMSVNAQFRLHCKRT
jgi:hypothetical protein